MNDGPIDNQEVEEEWVSRTEKKRNTEDMQVIARSLMKLSDNQRAKLPMSDELNDAILLAIKIKNTKEGFRRQLQLVAKMLRQGNSEEIKVALQLLTSRRSGSVNTSTELEMIRDEMLSKGDEAVNAFLELNPAAKRQRLRQLIRQANKEARLEKPLKTARELFLYIKSFK